MEVCVCASSSSLSGQDRFVTGADCDVFCVVGLLPRTVYLAVVGTLVTMALTTK